jgi:multiple sugar transport system substrate-binding protein
MIRCRNLSPDRYLPKTKKYFGFSDNFVPDPGNYRKDLWDAVGMVPDTWDDVRVGGRKIKEQFGNPVGIGLSQEVDTNMAMRALMYSFGSAEQDAEGRVTLNSKETVEAVKFVRALYKETMTPEVFTWDPASNNRFLISGKGRIFSMPSRRCGRQRRPIQTLLKNSCCGRPHKDRCGGKA